MRNTYPLVRLPRELDFCLYLIREELKSRRFFEGLQKVGIYDTFWQPHLDLPILQMMGLDCESDEVAEVYFEIMERRSKKVKAGKDSVVIQALKAHRELEQEKRRRQKIGKN